MKGKTKLTNTRNTPHPSNKAKRRWPFS